MTVLKYEFKEASPEEKQEMLSEIISKYNVSNKNELVQALAHAQAVLDCTQEEFSSHPDISLSTRMLRTYKKEYLDLYVSAFERYDASPELKDVEGAVDDDALEKVYQNLLARLMSKKTSTKDISIILEYFGITNKEFKNFADFRNTTLRAFLSDNLSRIITDESTALIVKSLIGESKYLYQGTQRTLGNTHNAMTMDINDPLVRLEMETLGLMFVSLMNGQATPAFENHAKALRMLKWASGDKEVTEGSHTNFDRMDGKKSPTKEVSLKDCMNTFGAEEGKQIFDKLTQIIEKAKDRKVIPLPPYETITEDYMMSLKAFPETEEKTWTRVIAKIDGTQTKINEKYKQFLKEINED